MAVFTALLDHSAHFGIALEQAQAALNGPMLSDAVKFDLQVRIAYCYAFLNLPKGVAVADETIRATEAAGDDRMKAYALCAKAMNLYRIGYTAKARAAAEAAVAIFEASNDEAGLGEACYQIGTMQNLNISLEDTPEYLRRAINVHANRDDATMDLLLRIQQAALLFFEFRFDEAVASLQEILDEIEGRMPLHLACIIYQHLAHGMWMKRDMHASKVYVEKWHEITVATGNFHDFTRSSCMLTEYDRQEHLDSDVVKRCIDAIACCKELGSYYGYATGAFVMGNICVDQNQFEDAIRYYGQVNDAGAEIGFAGFNHMALQGIGVAELKQGKTAQAKSTFETLLQKTEERGDVMHQIFAQRHLAEIALQYQAFDASLSGYRRLFEISDARSMTVTDHGNIACALAKASPEALSAAGIPLSERQAQQLRHLQSGLALARSQSHRPEEAKAYQYLSGFFEESGDLLAALDYRKRYEALHEQIVNEETNAAISRLRMHYEAEKKDAEIALLRKEKEEAQLVERLRISRDLHDDIGATLSSISVYSTAVKQRLADARLDEAVSILNIISDDARDMVTTMSDMVWMVNPQNDVLEKLLDHMQLLAANLLASQDVVLRFDADERLYPRSLAKDVRKNVFLFFKEAINNIAKYAAASSVRVHVGTAAGQLTLTIEDDGNGFDVDLQKRGNGLRNMRTRSAELDGIYEVISKPGAGTVIRLRFTPHNW